jgi:chlorite dismutase
MPAAATRPAGARSTKRQYLRFAFYALDPLWRRLPEERQVAHKRELLGVIESFGRQVLLRPYSLLGTRADVELLLWQIAESIEPFQELAARINSTAMGSYLRLSKSYLSQTKRSVYEMRDAGGEQANRLVIAPSEAKYLFVYPFVKTRPWYQLSLDERQALMDEHIRVGRKYPAVKLNTSYSFGLDDQEFVVAFETDEPADFLDLVQELRETKASMYTLQDTPLYSCIRMHLDQAFDALGGPPVASAHEPVAMPEAWTDAGPLETFPDNTTKVVYLAGQAVAVFRVNGKLFALSNRCSHARGPLSEGVVESTGESCTVTCPWHHGVFNLASGETVGGVVSAPVPAYRIRVENGVIRVGTPAPVELAVHA